MFDERIETLMRQLWAEASTGSPNGALYADGLTMALMGLLLSQYGKSSTRRSATQGLTYVQRRSALDYIEEHLASNLTIDEIARTTPLSADRFARAFKHTFGVSPHAFVLERRIDRTARLLRDLPSLPLVDVAAATGFSSQSHFTHTFKNRVGIPPKAWRRDG